MNTHKQVRKKQSLEDFRGSKTERNFKRENESERERERERKGAIVKEKEGKKHTKFVHELFLTFFLVLSLSLSLSLSRRS